MVRPKHNLHHYKAVEKQQVLIEKTFEFKMGVKGNHRSKPKKNQQI
jgi:hypothetical protein